MIKTYILNMEKDIEKRRSIERQLNRQKGLNSIIFKAIEGRKLTNEELSQWVDTEQMRKRYRNFSTLPAIGCALSHWNIYKLIIDNNDPYALILEDDALLSDNISQNIKSFESLLLTNNPVVILLTPEFTYSLSKKIASLNEFNIYKLNGGTMCSGYIVNHSAAKVLKERLFPIQYLADHWDIFSNFKIEILGVVPHIISYPQGLGEIGESQQNNYKKNMFQKIRYYMAGIKGKAYVFLFIYMRGLKISNKNW